MNRKSVRIGLLALVCLVPLDYLAAQGTPDPWFGRQARPKDFSGPMKFAGTFSIELPKDWQLAPGHTGTIISSVEKKKNTTGGYITLEYWALQGPFDPALASAASQVELNEVQKRELSGKGFTSEVKKGNFGPVIVVQYNRPGLKGDDHVVQYSIPVGSTMYRLICIAPLADLDKYRPMFAHVAASFTPVQLPLT